MLASIKLALEKLFGCLGCFLSYYLHRYNLPVRVNSSIQTGAGLRVVSVLCCRALLPQLVFNGVSKSGSLLVS